VRYTLGARYLYIKRNIGKVWGARYLPKNTVPKDFTHFSMLCYQTYEFLYMKMKHLADDKKK
jgi:hypothetical protein